MGECNGPAPYCYNEDCSLVESVVVSGDCSVMATSHEDSNIVELWELPSAEQRCSLVGHTSSIEKVVFSPDSLTVLTCSDDSTVRVWNTVTAQQLVCFDGHKERVTSAVFCEDGGTVVSCDQDCTSRFWNLESAEELMCLKGQSKSVDCLTLTSDGSILASGARDKTVMLWDVPAEVWAGQSVATLAADVSTMTTFEVSQDGGTAVGGFVGGILRLWNPDVPVQSVEFLTGPSPCYLTAVAVSFDGGLVAS